MVWADDAPNSFDAEIHFNVSEPQKGLYFIDVGSGFKYDIGAYEVLVDIAPLDDFADGLNDGEGSVGHLNVGDNPTSAAIQTPGDRDSGLRFSSQAVPHIKLMASALLA